MNVGSFAAIPNELRILPNWVCWRLEQQSNGKPTKRPYQINGQLANVSDPKTFNTFDACFNCLALGSYSGLGFVFTNTPYSGIDLDDAALLADGTPNPNYQLDFDRQLKVYREFDSYSERSPSGKGCHIIVNGKVPEGKRLSFIELYPSGRFFTMTGDVVNDKPIANQQEMLTLLWEQMGGNKPSILSNFEDGPETSTDEEIIALALKHNTDKFTPLLEGIISGYQSQSEADQAFTNIIGHYTNNRAQVKRIFTNSKLMRSKAKTHKTYLDKTINNAFDQKVPTVNIDALTQAYEAKKANAKALPPPKVNVYPSGLLGDIAQYIYSASNRPVFEVALAAAISLMAGITGRAYNVSGTGLNQYVLLLAMTGAGKEAAASGISKLMNTIKMQVPTSTSFIGPSEISSGSALFKYLGNTSQSFVSLLGEFGLRIQQLTSARANGAEVSLRRMILDVYNKSGHNDILAASIYSKKEDSTGSVPSPAFSILGESTPERLYGVLNEDMITEGFLPRFLLIEYKGIRVAGNPNHNAVSVPWDLTERLASLAAQCETINHANPRRVINVQSTLDATVLLDSFDKYADSKINGSDKDVLRQLWNRAHVKLLKLSALVAVGNNMIEPVITVDDILWASHLIQDDILTLTERFETGDIGLNSAEIKQHDELTRITKEYVQENFEYVSKYKAIAKMHHNKIITHTYLSLRLIKMAAFRNDRLGGTTALKRSIQNFVDSGKFIPVSTLELTTKYSTTQKAYYIDPSILD